MATSYDGAALTGAGAAAEEAGAANEKVTSVWQSEVQVTLMRISCALGGSTTMSSMVSGSPAALHTAAACFGARAREAVTSNG